jgi:CheY-like chemotaxis protein
MPIEQKILKALVIDDDPVITKVVSRVLVKRLQMDVREANSAKEALTFIEEDIPDIIIVDYMMPVMTGKDLITLLKADDKFKHIPIIVLSALSDPEIIKDILSLKVDDYILKPVSPQVIHERVIKVLKQSKEKKNYDTASVTNNRALIYIGNNKSLYLDTVNLLSGFLESGDFEPIPHKAFNLFLQKFHKIVVLEKQFDDIVNNLIIDKIKTTNPESILIYLIESDSTLLFLSEDSQNLPSSINEVLSKKIPPNRLSEVIQKYLKIEDPVD